MQKTEIIQRTVAAMRGEGGLLEADTEQPGGDSDDYPSSVVLPTMMQRLPDGVSINTCADFQHLQIACCEMCHQLYAHVDMYLEDLPNGNSAWICCAVRTALQNCGTLSHIDTGEDFDIEVALGHVEVAREA